MRRVVKGAAVVVALGVALAGVATASQTILGKSYVVKDPKPGVDATKRKAVVLGKELGSPDTVVGDPTVNGATVEIIANGANPSSQTFVLPAGPLWTAIKGGFKYVDKFGANGPVKVALIKKSPAPNNVFLVKAVVVGLLGPITVLPPNPGTTGGMIFTINGGGGDSYCVNFGGAAGGLVVNSTNKVFKVASPVTAPTTEVGCPALGTTTTTTSTTTTSISTTSTTLLVTLSLDVQPILTPNCTTMTACHGNLPGVPGMDLRPGAAHASLVGVTSVFCAPKVRVVPGSPATSYLIEKISSPTPSCFTSPMPPLPNPPLSAAQIATITAWIAQGALNN